jgi:hypothetical protein
VLRNKDGEIIGTIKEPDAFPHLQNVAPPRRAVSSKDFPQQPLIATDADGVPIEEEPVLDEPAPEDRHENNDDLLDNPDDS